MSGFGYPFFLTLLALAPILVFLYYRAGRRDARAREAFSDPAQFAALGLGERSWRNAAVPVLVIAATALAATALARPLGPPSGDEEKPIAMDVIVAVDVSDSMGVHDVPENRLAAARGFVKLLVAAAPDNRYGLVLFSGDAVVTCPMTLDHDAFLTFIEDADFQRANLPGTAVGEAILTAATRFKKDELPRAVVVVTDGENTYGADPVKAAEDARQAGLKVYTVGVGTASGGRIPAGYDFFENVVYKLDKEGRVVNSSLDEAALKGISDAGGGKYMDASGPGAVKQLAGELSVKGKKVVKDPFRGAKEYGPWFALGAGIMAAAILIL